MTADADEFIEDFLAHWSIPHPHYDPRKAHEYYMKTRKLVGRGVKKTQNIDLNPLNNDSNKSVSLAKARAQAIHDKLDRLDGAVKKLPPHHRNAIQKKLDEIRAKLHKIHNPFEVTTNADGSRQFGRPKHTTPKHSSLDINPNARLDTSQIIDKRAKNDPTRGRGENKSPKAKSRPR